MLDDPIPFHCGSIRLNEYDYSSPGAYFVTVVTYQRVCLFGEVTDGEMQINIFGGIAKDEWFHTTTLRPYVQLYKEEFVVMPNHIHGIIWIEELNNGNGRGAATLHPYV
jgi:putative transposase